MLCCTAGSLLAVVVLPAAEKVQFNRDVRPILSEHCIACHGPDANKRKAGLRLDTKEGLFEKTPKHEPAVVPGKLAQSELWSRITTTNLDDRMPPEDSHKELKPEQIATLEAWIVAGAPWQGHWAFLKPERPPVPSKFKVQNPIDAFVLAKLQEKGLKPNTEADRRTLMRRVSLDLTGLPPTPEEVTAFVKDQSPDAYGQVVKRLLASPRYGEHRARYWLDAARYADTHGLHFDNYREMWPYRDWVIQAFNRNLPFDRFTKMQIAGDLFDHPERDDLVASGFQRCNPTTNEGGTIDDENLANYANDRVTTLSWVYLGLTMNCAACHDHKFDPITQKDFYSMAAFFRNTVQPPKDGNSKDSTPSVLVPQTEADAKRWDVLPKELASAKEAVEARKKAAKPDFTNWIARASAADLHKDLEISNLVVHVPLNVKDTNEVRGVFGGVTKSIKVPGTNDWQDGELGPALVLNKGATLDLGAAGDFEKDQPFSYGAWVRVSKATGNAGILARMDVADAFRGWDLYQNDKKFSVHIVHKWPDDAFKVTTKADLVKEKTWQHVFVTYDGSGKASGVKMYVDGKDVAVKAESDALKGSIRTKVSLRVGQRSQDHVLERGRVQDVRLFARKLAAKEVLTLASVPRVQTVLGLAEDKRTKAQQDMVFDFWIGSRDPAYVERSKHQAALKTEEEKLKERNPVTHIQREKTNSMPMAYVLFRGQYDKQKDQVVAAAPGVLHRWPGGAPTNRLGLAQWIISPENPLTARVTVNRFWQDFFGTGLVKSTEDFGITGDSPTHPELLDWLAVEFQQSGWDVKHLLELIVTSSAYRQGAQTTKEKLEKDPQNRFFSRGPRFRMDAEMVRDSALAASGLLVEKIGGASVKPYQPDGIWEAVAMPESNTKKYKRDTGEGLYRRSLYTFWKRAAPPASMDIFNAPSREVCTVRRERTNTPLQALATLNDPQFIEAARFLAQLALANSKRDEDALQLMGERVLSRPLTSKELSIVKGTLKEMRAYYDQQPEAAKQFLAVGDAKVSDKIPAPQLAAMTMVANQLMNLDEALNK